MSGPTTPLDPDLFEPGSRRCTFEGCARDAAVPCSDDGHIALCSEHGGEYEVLRQRFKEAPTQATFAEFQRVWVAAQGGARTAATRMNGYAQRKRLLGHG